MKKMDEQQDQQEEISAILKAEIKEELLLLEIT